MNGQLTDADRTADDLNADDTLTVAYESVYDPHGDLKTVSGTVTDPSYSTAVEFESDDGDTYTLALDGGEAMELKKHDADDVPRRIGYPDAVAAQDDDEAEAVEPNDLDADALDAGQALELTYDSNNSSGTERVVYVVEVYDRYPRTDGEDLTVVAADPAARRSRFVRFDPHRVAPHLYSLNSKSDTGRRVGRVCSVRPLPTVSDTHAAGAEVRQAAVGDVVRVEGDRYVVTADRGSGAEVESVSGDELRLASRPAGATADVPGEYDPTPVEAVERTGTAHRNGVAADLLDACTGYGHDHPAGKVVAVEVEGERFEVVYRHEADDEGIRMASADVDAARRDYDARLTCDPLGLTLTTGQSHPHDSDVDAENRRVSTDDVTLVREGEVEDDDEDEDETAEQDDAEPVLVTDGGHDVPTPDDLLALDAGDEVMIHLADGDEPVTATVDDPRHPNLGGRDGAGQVTRFFRTPDGRRAITAYHEDKNPERQAERAVYETPSVHAHDRREVESIHHAETDGDAIRPGPEDEPVECPQCGEADLDDTGTCPECGLTVATDGGRERGAEAAVEAILGADDETPERDLRTRRHEALTTRLDALRGVRSVAADRGNATLYDAVNARMEQIRRELSHRQAERRARDEDDGRFDRGAA